MILLLKRTLIAFFFYKILHRYIFQLEKKTLHFFLIEFI
jgi:hypothetical protein